MRQIVLDRGMASLLKERSLELVGIVVYRSPELVPGEERGPSQAVDADSLYVQIALSIRMFFHAISDPVYVLVCGQSMINLP